MAGGRRLAVLAGAALLAAGGVGLAWGQGQSRDLSIEAMRTEKRVGLVIGNGAYPRDPLRNPVNDARAIAQALRALGFDVLEHANLDEKAMR